MTLPDQGMRFYVGRDASGRVDGYWMARGMQPAWATDCTDMTDDEMTKVVAECGYWCVVCDRFLPSEDGVIVHDDVPHPDDMTFDDDERPQ